MPEASDQERLEAATAHLDPPFAVVDLDGFDTNGHDLARRARRKPLRLASKSVRCRHLLHQALALPGYQGVMSYALREAIWLARDGVTDILLAYPTVDRAALRELAGDEQLTRSITLMIDDTSQLDFITRHVDTPHPPLRVCLDIDASLRVLGLHLGVRRSPVHTPRQALDLANAIRDRSDCTLHGLMFYDAQVAGLPDSSPAIRMLKQRSLAALTERRFAVLGALQPAADIRLVNAGGTGSVHHVATDPVVTEITAGSGLFGPTLFDGYRSFRPQPAAMFALPVVRRPTRRIATVFAGGYLASGTATRNRLPLPSLPEGLRLLRAEGAGEVQTPVAGGPAEGLPIGARVWFRHAKAGELCERFDALHLIRGDEVVDVVSTYRGEGRNFG